MPVEFDPDRWAHHPFAAGAMGALVALRWVPGTGWLERLINAAAGMLIAGYGSPAAAEWLHLTSPGMLSALAFVTGLFGLSLVAAAMQALRDLKLAEIISGWVSRKG